MHEKPISGKDKSSNDSTIKCQLLLEKLNTTSQSVNNLSSQLAFEQERHKELVTKWKSREEKSRKKVQWALNLCVPYYDACSSMRAVQQQYLIMRSQYLATSDPNTKQNVTIKSKTAPRAVSKMGKARKMSTLQILVNSILPSQSNGKNSESTKTIETKNKFDDKNSFTKGSLEYKELEKITKPHVIIENSLASEKQSDEAICMNLIDLDESMSSSGLLNINNRDESSKKLEDDISKKLSDFDEIFLNHNINEKSDKKTLLPQAFSDWPDLTEFSNISCTNNSRCSTTTWDSIDSNDSLKTFDLDNFLNVSNENSLDNKSDNPWNDNSLLDLTDQDINYNSSQISIISSEISDVDELLNYTNQIDQSSDHLKIDQNPKEKLSFLDDNSLRELFISYDDIDLTGLSPEIIDADIKTNDYDDKSQSSKTDIIDFYKSMYEKNEKNNLSLIPTPEDKVYKFIPGEIIQQNKPTEIKNYTDQNIKPSQTLDYTIKPLHTSESMKIKRPTKNEVAQTGKALLNDPNIPLHLKHLYRDKEVIYKQYRSNPMLRVAVDVSRPYFMERETYKCNAYQLANRCCSLSKQIATQRAIYQETLKELEDLSTDLSKKGQSLIS